MGMSTNKAQSRAVMSEINVTPLVDVMLVLLIIFMVTAPLMQQGIQVDLPETETAGVKASEEPLILVITKSGKISIADKVLAEDDLKVRLSAIFETRKNKDVYIQADKKVAYGVVAQAMATVKSTGATSISLITLPK